MFRRGLLPLELFFEKKKKILNEINYSNSIKGIHSFVIREKNPKKIKKISLYISNLFHFKKKFFKTERPISFFFKKILKQKGYMLFQNLFGLEIYFLEKDFNFELLIFHLEMKIKNNFYKKKPAKKLLVTIQKFEFLTHKQQKKIRTFFQKFSKNSKLIIIASDKFKMINMIKKSSQVIKRKKFFGKGKSGFSNFLLAFFKAKNLFLLNQSKSVKQGKKKTPQDQLKKSNMWLFLSKKNTNGGMFFTVYENVFFFVFGLFDLYLKSKPNFFQPIIERGGGRGFSRFYLKGISRWIKKLKLGGFQKWKKVNYLALFKIVIIFEETRRKII